MDNFELNENRCGNCKYYIKHYINKNGTFILLSSGHCICTKLNIRKRLNVYTFNCCEYWENGEEKIIQRHKNIEDALYKMADSIEHFIQIIKEEKSQK